MTYVKITILIDDINGVEIGYMRSYGFAALIEINNKRILFDTGTKIKPLLHNLRMYNISPSELDAVILSHNHFDHTNGLQGILRENEDIPVYIHKEWNTPASYKGYQVPKKNYILNEYARECKEICKGIYLSNCHVSGDYGGIHEHACYIKAPSSYILMCGCCHPGLNKFLNDREQLGISIKNQFDIIGGFHGFKFENAQVKDLNQFIKSIIICHCTMNGKTFFEQFPEKSKIGKVGKTIIFN
ncbi:MAG: MBL fold metallo-hydrolase [Promethearchaeota archaeon]